MAGAQGLTVCSMVPFGVGRYDDHPGGKTSPGVGRDKEIERLVLSLSESLLPDPGTPKAGEPWGCGFVAQRMRPGVTHPTTTGSVLLGSTLWTPTRYGVGLGEEANCTEPTDGCLYYPLAAFGHNGNDKA